MTRVALISPRVSHGLVASSNQPVFYPAAVCSIQAFSVKLYSRLFDRRQRFFQFRDEQRPLIQLLLFAPQPRARLV